MKKTDSPENDIQRRRKHGQVYAELLCDFMFKRLFGSEANKDVLIDFLNVIFDDIDIVDVNFIPTEHLGVTDLDRKAIFDISCKCQDGRTLIIEMQKGYQEHFRERAVYYTSFPINEQGRLAKEKYIKEQKDGGGHADFKWDYNLHPVTVVAILNFKFDHDKSWPKERFHSSYRLREDCTNEIMTDVVRYIFLELGRFRKSLWELETVFDKWMYLLRHMHEMVEIPKPFQTPEFERLFILAEIGNFTPEEHNEYEKSLQNMSDYYNIIDSAVVRAQKIAREEGRAEGMAEGMKAGREEGMAEGLKAGREEGMAEGMKAGREEGMAEGMAEGMKAGREEGMAEGMMAGREEGRAEIVRQLHMKGIAPETISEMLDMPIADIKAILA